MKTTEEASAEVERLYRAWQETHDPLADLGFAAAQSGDFDTAFLAQLLLVDLPPAPPEEL